MGFWTEIGLKFCTRMLGWLPSSVPWSFWDLSFEVSLDRIPPFYEGLVDCCNTPHLTTNILHLGHLLCLKRRWSHHLLLLDVCLLLPNHSIHVHHVRWWHHPHIHPSHYHGLLILLHHVDHSVVHHWHLLLLLTVGYDALDQVPRLVAIPYLNDKVVGEVANSVSKYINLPHGILECVCPCSLMWPRLTTNLVCKPLRLQSIHIYKLKQHQHKYSNFIYFTYHNATGQCTFYPAVCTEWHQC